jgi:ribosomal protein S18 acetylase RimI-like enzyme
MMIRPAREADLDAIGNLWLELVQYHRDLDDNMPIPAQDGSWRYVERIRHSLDSTHYKIYVAEIDQKIVGYVLGMIVDLVPEMFLEERAGMVADICVTQTHRHQGVGKALMYAIRDWFLLRGVQYFEWYVAASNQSGLEFWEKAMGGKPVMIRMRADLSTNHESEKNND